MIRPVPLDTVHVLQLAGALAIAWIVLSVLIGLWANDDYPRKPSAPRRRTWRGGDGW